MDRRELVRRMALRQICDDFENVDQVILPHLAGELPSMPPLDAVEEDFETCFYVTKKGLDPQRSGDPWFPYDEEGNLRPDWHLGPPRS